MKRYTWLLIGVLLALTALVGGAGAAEDSAVPAQSETVTAGGEFPIGPFEGDKGSPSAEMDAGGNMIVAWGYDDVFFQRLSPTGAPLGIPIQVNTTSSDIVWPTDIAADAAGNFVVIWSNVYPDKEVRGRCYAADGSPRSPEFAVAAGGYREESAAVEMAPDGAFVVVWTQAQPYPASDQINGRRFSAACAPLGEPFLFNDIDTGDEYYPDIAMDAAGNFLVAWVGVDEDGQGVFARYFDHGGAPRGGQFRVNQRQQFSQLSPSVGMDAAGNAVIAFESAVARIGSDYNWDVLARRYAADGTPVGDVFNPRGPNPHVEYSPEVVVAPTGRFAITWTTTFNSLFQRDVWLRTYEANGVPVGPARPVVIAEWYNSPAILAAGSGDTFLAAWVTSLVGGEPLTGRLFNFGEVVAPQVLIPTHDTYVMEQRPNATYGARPVLQVKNARNAPTDVHAYLKFDVSGLSGAVDSATLRLQVKKAGLDGGLAYAVSPFYQGTTTPWLETGLTWNNAPPVESFYPQDEWPGRVSRRQWVELDVTGAVRAALAGDGQVSLVITNNSTKPVSFGSSESPQSPQLVIIMK